LNNPTLLRSQLRFLEESIIGGSRENKQQQRRGGTDQLVVAQVEPAGLLAVALGDPAGHLGPVLAGARQLAIVEGAAFVLLGLGGLTYQRSPRRDRKHPGRERVRPTEEVWERCDRPR